MKRNLLNKIRLNSIILGVIGILIELISLFLLDYVSNLKIRYTLLGIFSLIVGIIFILTSFKAKKEGHKAIDGFYRGWLGVLICGVFFIICSIYYIITLIFDL